MWSGVGRRVNMRTTGRRSGRLLVLRLTVPHRRTGCDSNSDSDTYQFRGRTSEKLLKLLANWFAKGKGLGDMLQGSGCLGVYSQNFTCRTRKPRSQQHRVVGYFTYSI